MNEFKKSVFGGYKKPDVDAAVDELHKKLENAEAERIRIEKNADDAGRRVSELEKQLSDTDAENSRLKSELAQREIVFGDIAKIYKRAYGAGHEIVCDSKETAQKLLRGIEDRFDEMLGDTQEIIREYEAVYNDIKNIIAILNKDINSISESADTVFDKAKSFSGIYGQIKNTVDSARQDTEKLLSEYDIQASEYLSVDSSVSADSSEACKNAGTDIHTEIKQEVSGKTVTESTQFPVLTVLTGDRQINNEQVPAAEQAETEPLSSSANEETVSASEESMDTEKAADYSEQNAPAEANADNNSNVAVPVAAIATDSSDIAQQEKTPKQNTEKEEPEKDTPEKGSAEFTQYGRKSKISAEDRSEILRKALLKNGIS